MDMTLDLLPHVPSKERINVLAYFLCMIFERKMSTVYKVDFGIWYILFEGLRSRGEEYGIVLAPDCEDRRLVFAQGLVPLGILLYVVLVVVEQG